MTKQIGIICCPVAEYMKLYEQFQKEHPQITIQESIKNVSLQTIVVPHPTILKETVQQQVVIVIHVIFYTEKNVPTPILTKAN